MACEEAEELGHAGRMSSITAWWNIRPTGPPDWIARGDPGAQLERARGGPSRCGSGARTGPGTPSGSARDSRDSTRKPSSASAVPVSARAAVPGRREDRVDPIAEQVGQAVAAGLDVAALSLEPARRAELALAPLALVVGVREAVLVQPHPRPRQRARAPGRRPAPAGSPRGRPAARAPRTRRAGRAGGRRPSRRRRRGRTPAPARARRRAPPPPAAAMSPCHLDTGLHGFVTNVCLAVSHRRNGSPPQVSRIRAHGLPARLGDVHLQRAPAGRAGGRADAAVRRQAGRGARARAPPSRGRRHPGPPRAPARRGVADQAAAPLAPRRPRAVPARDQARRPAPADAASPERSPPQPPRRSATAARASPARARSTSRSCCRRSRSRTA